MINVVWGSTEKPISSKRLAETLGLSPDLEGTLYIGYPIIGTPEGSFPIDALLVSPSKGLILFSVVEGKILPNYAQAQDEAFNKMQAKLLQHQSLIRKRQLLVNIQTITFAPAIVQLEEDEEHPVCNAGNLLKEIDEIEDEPSDVFPSLISVIQAISTLRVAVTSANLAFSPFPASGKFWRWMPRSNSRTMCRRGGSASIG